MEPGANKHAVKKCFNLKRKVARSLVDVKQKLYYFCAICIKYLKYHQSSAVDLGNDSYNFFFVMSFLLNL